MLKNSTRLSEDKIRSLKLSQRQKKRSNKRSQSMMNKERNSKVKMSSITLSRFISRWQSCTRRILLRKMPIQHSKKKFQQEISKKMVRSLRVRFKAKMWPLTVILMQSSIQFPNQNPPVNMYSKATLKVDNMNSSHK